MRLRTCLGRTVLALAVTTAAATSQSPRGNSRQPAAPSDPATTALVALRNQLTQGRGLAPAERLLLVRDFLQRFREQPTHDAVLSGWLLAGSIELERLDAAAAMAAFDQVLTHAPASTELRASARFGAHQAHCLAGERDLARQQLDRLLADSPESALAPAAKAAQQWLRTGSTPPRQNEPLPPLQLGTDLRGRPWLEADLRGAPALLVFFACNHEASRKHLDKLATAWRDGGKKPGSLIAFALESDPVALQRLVQQRGYEFPILPSPDGFLHPDWLALHVTGVPTCFLVDPSGRLLARDLSPDRLAALIRGD